MKIIRQLVVVLISQSLLFVPIIHAADLTLSTNDITAPEIKHSLIRTAASSGETIRISAAITDNSGVKEAVLFYRDVGASQFIRQIMWLEIGSDIYATTLTAIQPPGIEYYIQATDIAGNSLLHGHSFSPLTVEVVQPESDTQSHTLTENMDENKGVSKWVWIGLGVLAVGALAAAGGGDDDGSSNDPGPTSGTVTINANTPQ